MTLAEALGSVAARGTGHELHVFRGGQEAERIGFDRLYAEAGQLACGLLERGVVPGERVAVALPTSVDFARAFFGVVSAGAVAIPLPPPFRFASLDVHMRRIATAMRQSRVRVVLSNKMLGALLEPALRDAQGGFSILDVAQVPAASAVYADVAAGAPALVQYTSGTIENPKGVVLSHANVLANVAAITESIGITEVDVGCNWLPLFHDMGLIGTFLTSVLNGLETCLLPPEDFLRDPGRWVRVISRHRATITAAPDTGYLHTLRKVSGETVRELDLSSWRVALNGAETIDPDTIRQFAAHFAPAGFRQTAFIPVYGLAEGTLAVTCSPVGRPVRTAWVRRDLLGQGIVAFATPGAELAREVAAVGTPVAGTDVRLVGEDGTVLPDGITAGEIQIRGASVMRGYEAGGQASRDGIHDGGWVSTGDLGFRLDGELYIAGRKKEMVIVLGQNHYASDIESVAGRLPGVSVNGLLAASVRFADGEGLVLIAETRETCPQARSELVAQIRQAVSGGLGITPREVILAERGRLPRTSSGKLQRHGTTALYERLRTESAAVDAADLADQPYGRQES